MLRLAAAALITAAALVPAGDAWTQPLDGDWGGWAAFGDDAAQLQLHFAAGDSRLHDIDAGRYGQRIEDLDVSGDRLSFTYRAPLGRLVFDGTRAGDRIDGTVELEGSELTGTFHFTRFHQSTMAERRSHLGSFRGDGGLRMWSFPRSLGGIRLVFLENEEWGYGTYLPWRPDAYFYAALKQPCLPPEDWIELHEGGAVLVQQEPGTIRTARRTDALHVRPVTWRSGDLRIVGQLIHPAGDGPFPTAVQGHGSGPTTADSPFGLYYALRMVELLDVAVLRWDKRGAGGSDGDWETATYHQLADDVLAAVEFARTQPEVDRARIGLAGVSQAPSWVLPIAAVDDPEIAFIIAVSGQVGTIVEADLFNMSNRLRQAGFDEEQVTEGLDFLRGAMEYMVDPDRQAEYDAYIHSHADRPWFDLLHGLLKLDTPLTAGPIEQWRQIKDVDSSTLWPRIDCPVMQAFGEADVLVDTELSVGRMQQMIDATGKTNFTIHVYPAPVGHSVGYENEAYWDDLRAWWETVQSDWAVQDE